MLSTAASADGPSDATGARRTTRRALTAVLSSALAGAEHGARGHVRYAVEVFDERLQPLLANAGDLTPYDAELLAEAVCQGVAPLGWISSSGWSTRRRCRR